MGNKLNNRRRKKRKKRKRKRGKKIEHFHYYIRTNICGIKTYFYNVMCPHAVMPVDVTIMIHVSIQKDQVQ